MPFYDDHPVRDLMRRGGLKRVELAQAAGVTYGAVDKLMMGMTKSVHPEIASVLAQRTGVPPVRIRELVDEWNETPLLEKLPPRARATLLFGPDDLSAIYTSFRGWREEFAENPTQFASILRIPRATLVEYETGKRAMFPPSMAEAIGKQFGVPVAYTSALAELPPDDAMTDEPTASVVTLPPLLANPFLRDDPHLLDDVQPVEPPVVHEPEDLSYFFDQPAEVEMEEADDVQSD